jgi:uncharacterized tellurite resistance protein B-like protein
MYERLKLLFREITSEPESVDDGTAVPMAATMLLLEVAWADHEISSAELERIRTTVTKLFALPQQLIDDVIDRAQTDHQTETSLYPFARVLNDALTLEEKVELVTELWQLAYAEDGAGKYEEHRVRHIAELLHMPHSQFIAAKLRAKERGRS